MVQNCDNDILEGLEVTSPPQTQNPLFLSWRDKRLKILFPFEPTIEVKCSLINEYVKSKVLIARALLMEAVFAITSLAFITYGSKNF